MHRFFNTKLTPKQLPPVCEYLTHRLLPLQTAIEPISSQIDQLDRFAQIAKNECHFPSEHGLSHEESAAILLYTMETGDNSLHQVLNRALCSEDQLALKSWFAYLKLFHSAIQKLPTVQYCVLLGATRDVAHNYKKGDEFTWWGISSCSTSVNVIKNFLAPNPILFLIEIDSGKDISNYANFPSENEVILLPGTRTRLRVVSDAPDQANLHLVHLQEVCDETESTADKLLSVEPSIDTNGDQYQVFIHIHFK